MSERAQVGMGLDEFLGHSSRGGDGGGYLSKWRKRVPPKVDVWLHTRALFIALWQHNWPKIIELKDPNDPARATRVVQGRSFNCLESEDVLKDQYRRDRQTGKRVKPPRICPMCLMIEEVRTAVASGELPWVEPLFRFQGDPGTEGKILHAGGIFGAFKSKTLTNEEKAEMASARIYQKDAWREELAAKCQYVFSVVDNDDVGKGCQVAVEGALLGDKVRALIHRKIEQLGDQEGNPVVTPYAIRWKYLPDEAEFHKKYDAIDMPNIQPSDEVMRLISEEAPPDVSRITSAGNIKTLRAEMESHCLFDLEWDAIFGPSEQFLDANGFYIRPSAPKKEEAPAASPKAATAPKRQIKPAAKAPPVAASTDSVPCDQCKKLMPANETRCPHCGIEYQFDPDDATAPPPPVAAAPAAKKQLGKGRKAPAPRPEGDDIPF